MPVILGGASAQSKDLPIPSASASLPVSHPDNGGWARSRLIVAFQRKSSGVNFTRAASAALPALGPLSFDAPAGYSLHQRQITGILAQPERNYNRLSVILREIGLFCDKGGEG